MKNHLILFLILAANVVVAQVEDSVYVNQSKTLEADSVQKEPIIIKYYQVGESKSEVKKEEPKVKKERSGDQIKTLNKNSRHNGFFFALGVKTSAYADQTLVMTGVRIGWIINRSLAIGLDGFGVLPTVKFEEEVSIDGQAYIKYSSLVGKTAGIFLEPIFFSNEVIHLTFPISSGIGYLGYGNNSWDYEMSEYDSRNTDVFWYIEPGANLEINVARSFRVAFGVTKRFTQDTNRKIINDKEFDQLSYFLTLKIGRF